MSQKRISNWREKAKRSLDLAKELHDRGDYDFAISRAYYAMFYIAEALQLKKEKNYSTHSALLAGFFENYIQTGLLQRKFHSILREAYDLREKVDYRWEHLPTKDLSRCQIQNCEEFFEATERFFKG